MIFRAGRTSNPPPEAETHYFPFEEDPLEAFRIAPAKGADVFALEPALDPDNDLSASPKQQADPAPAAHGVDGRAQSTGATQRATSSTAASARNNRYVPPHLQITGDAAQTEEETSRASAPTISPRLRDDLAAAVIAWWQSALLPSANLLKEGLLALEAGVTLDPSQRTLLGRTALARGRGVITALRHINDPDRVASLVYEAWSNGAISQALLDSLLRDTRLGFAWQRPFADDLRSGLTPVNTAVSRRAETGLQHLAQAVAEQRRAQSDDAYALQEESSARRASSWFYLTVLGLVAVLAGIWYWQTRAPDYGDVVAVPAGVYQVTDVTGATVSATVDAFAIDRTEVTNREYAACHAAGACPFVAAPDAPDRPNYHLDERFADYPVVNMTWEAANAFCAWRSMRLPSVVEFEIAARYAPLTDRYYRYPWGDLFSSAFVISSETAEGSAQVGSRSPQGDSPLGIADLSGNVSEWSVTSPYDAPQLAYIKGGSWRDASGALSLLNPANVQTFAKNDSAAWLGFRCAATTS